jgi:hypothetical protein
MCDGGGVVQAAGNSSSVTGGAWARRIVEVFPSFEAVDRQLPLAA